LTEIVSLRKQQAMTIKFQTKEESKQEQQEAFLKLRPSERVWRFFLALSYHQSISKKSKGYAF